ncbi:MAG: class I SAM-dependent methyltransferase [Stackebrandtia sp.]
MYSDADAAALYDIVSPWDGERFPADRFYDELVLAAESVLDVGCGTGSMLRQARERGHRGRLAGFDPDGDRLAIARRREDVEWRRAVAVEAGWDAEFALATMTSHAFQCLVTDAELRSSLTAIRAALRPGGRFAFETRHPQARAWRDWNPGNAAEVTDATGRVLRAWHEVQSVIDDVVTFTGTTAEPDGTVLRVDTTSLRFLDESTLDLFLDEAGFDIDARYGDWDASPVTGTSTEIITIARRP